MHLTGCQIPNAAVKISFTLPLQGSEAFRHELYVGRSLMRSPFFSSLSARPRTFQLIDASFSDGFV
jgi:hypothetical protein